MAELPIFLTDVDDVLANFAFAAKDLLSEILGREWTFDDMIPGKWDMFENLNDDQMRRVQEAINDYGWVWSLKPCPDTQEAIAKLREMADVYVVTSAMSWAPVRMEWLRKHFGFDKEHLVFTKAKHLVRGDFFLDDHPDFVRRWQQHNPRGQGMLWTAPNNIHLIEGNDDIRVLIWSVVFDRVREWRPADLAV